MPSTKLLDDSTAISFALTSDPLLASLETGVAVCLAVSSRFDASKCGDNVSPAREVVVLLVLDPFFGVVDGFDQSHVDA